MAEPFISEIRMFGFGWPPRGWAKCDGQIMPINQNQALYSLIGGTYGGDSRTTFALPDMRGRVPTSFGTSNNQTPLGERNGAEYVTLTDNEMPAHTHSLRGTTENSDAKAFSNTIFASAVNARTSEPSEFYTAATDMTRLSSESVTVNGGGNSHYNMQPSEVVNFCIALTGTFPSRN